MNYSRIASGFGAIIGVIVVAVLFLSLRPIDSICIPVSFGGGIVGAMLGALLSNLYFKNQKKLRNSIRFFRKIGFFAEDVDISDSEIIDIINKKHLPLFGEEINPKDPLSDLLLLSHDHNRVWWKDTEADVLDGNNVYIDFINDLSSISRGIFLPSNVSETWESDEGPITIEFELGEKKHIIKPKYIYDYIDVEIIKEINMYTSSNKYKFEMYRPFDQTAFIVVLSKKEKRLLQRMRGWVFFSL